MELSIYVVHVGKRLFVCMSIERGRFPGHNPVHVDSHVLIGFPERMHKYIYYIIIAERIKYNILERAIYIHNIMIIFLISY